MSLLSELFAPKKPIIEANPPLSLLDIGLIKGHKLIKQGLLISAVGRHNLLVIGPPGEGKSALLSTLPGFLPPQTQEEYNELKYIYHYSVTPPNIDIEYRPFIQVSAGITESGLLGGGHKATPGAISLAHSGVLFMDEFSEYPKKLLESLRVPLEAKEITISRAGKTITFPCNIQLVCAMNPCPCGYYGSSKCTCTQSEVKRFYKRLSGPILDRIDITLEVKETSVAEKFSLPFPGQSKRFQQFVESADSFRIKTRNQYHHNRDIPGHEAFNPSSQLFNWSPGGLKSFKSQLALSSISTRKGIQLAKLSRSVADLLGEHHIEEKHLLMVKGLINEIGN